MPRFPRAFMQTSFLHIISQGLNKSFIFNEEEDIKFYISSMFSIKNEYNIKIIAYCIMNNHSHLLVETNSIQSLSSYMHKLNTKFACYYNKKYNHVGHVFRNRFKSEGIYSEQHLYSCVNYIFNNPVKAGLCKNSKDYKFSNYVSYVSKHPHFSDILNAEYNFIEIDNEATDEKCKNIINSFLNEKNINLEIVFNTNEYLRELLLLLHGENISFRSMERNLNFSRQKIKLILLDLYN